MRSNRRQPGLLVSGTAAVVLLCIGAVLWRWSQQPPATVPERSGIEGPRSSDTTPPDGLVADLERRFAALSSAQEALERRIDALERACGREPQAPQASGLPEDAQLRTWIAEAVKAELLHREGEAFVGVTFLL